MVTRLRPPLPELIDDGDVVVRRWTPDDAEILHHVVTESTEHLRPWMQWVGERPETVAIRRGRLQMWESEWAAGGDVNLGIFVDGVAAGGCGLHRRRGRDTLEIGYWLHPAFVGRGLMSRVVALLTSTAFTVPGTEHVEIHHDKANTRSAAVPRRLGFEWIGEADDRPTAPAEIGVDCTWRMDRARWAERHAAQADSPQS